jgi:integrase
VRHKPYYRLIENNLHLGYRRMANKPGTWMVRRYVGEQAYVVENLRTSQGDLIIADDYSDANGVGVLSFAQAQAKAKEKRPAGMQAKAYTVANALDDYFAAIEGEHRSTKDTRTRANALILPKLGKLEVAALTAKQLTNWRNDLAASGARMRTKQGAKQQYREAAGEDAKRARRASANRTWTILRAALNLAFKNGEVPSRDEWGKVKPFEGVDAARLRYLTVEEAKRLVNAAEGDFRLLLQGLLATGARYGQLAALRVGDFHRAVGAVDLRSRKGRGKVRTYNCVLTEEGRALFEHLTAGRARDELIFRKVDGSGWGKDDTTRPLAAAVKLAKIKPISIHGLRHTWASLSVMAGMPLMVVARNLGHVDTSMVEKHYGHLAPSFIAEAIRENAPRFGFKPGNVKPMRVAR